MIRVRFAPSPTGFLHIGGLRTCLYNWLFAKKNKGRLILRIEDTDRQRYVEGATENLIKTLTNVGLSWDEGPSLFEIKGTEKIIQKGKYGPYIQSQRAGNYQSLAQKLVDNEYAYYCFCAPEELKKMRQKQIEAKLPPMYDGRCRNLSKKEIGDKLKQGLPYVIRLKVPEKGSIKFKDLIRGQVKFDVKTIDDQILLKSDNWPTYHLANVIDDHLMGITHVIRGEEWLPSTPKHILIYRAFDWPVPQFAHLPLLFNPDHSKLSKRQGDVAAEDYLAQGYLPEALLNFLSLLGWNPGTEQEIFNLKQLTKEFSLEKIQKAGAIFNREKLNWMNGVYIRKIQLDELTKLCIPYLIKSGLIRPRFKNEQYPPAYGGYLLEEEYIVEDTKEKIELGKLKKIVALERERLKRLDEVGELTKFFFVDKLEYDIELLRWKKMTNEQIKNSLEQAKTIISGISEKQFKAKTITDILMTAAKKIGTGELFWPLRVALTGRKASPPPGEVAEILGKEKVLERINQVLTKIKNK